MADKSQRHCSRHCPRTAAYRTLERTTRKSPFTRLAVAHFLTFRLDTKCRACEHVATKEEKRIMAILLIATLVCLSGYKGRCDIHLLHLLSVDKLGLSDLLHLCATLLIHTYIRTFTILRYGKFLTVEYKSCVVHVRHCA